MYKRQHDQIAPHMSGGPTARDALLLKCRDAIESLHIELEEERQEKQRIGDEMEDLQRMF